MKNLTLMSLALFVLLACGAPPQKQSLSAKSGADAVPSSPYSADDPNTDNATPSQATAPSASAPNPTGSVSPSPSPSPAAAGAQKPATTPGPSSAPSPAPSPTAGDGDGKHNAAALKVIAYLKSISGKKTLAGQHNKEPNSDPTMWTRYIEETTSKSPAVWSGDFLFNKSDIDNRKKMIAEAINQWNKGALVNLMAHVCPPVGPETCTWDNGVFKPMSESEWDELLKDGSALNKTWKARLDTLAVYIAELKTAGVAPMFRPFHEMNQKGFWWGQVGGKEQKTAALYRLTHDYMVKTKGLTNIVWVWDIQDLDWNWKAFNPGNDYWDIFALDVYNPDNFTTKKYEEMLKIAGDKPIAIGECQVLPTAKELEAQPRWVFFMAWAELVQEFNSKDKIKATYNATTVLTRDELPGWK